MTITGANEANIAPQEVLEAEGRGADSPLLDIMGPVFLGVGVAALIAGVSMCMYARYPMRGRDPTARGNYRANAGKNRAEEIRRESSYSPLIIVIRSVRPSVNPSIGRSVSP